MFTKITDIIRQKGNAVRAYQAAAAAARDAAVADPSRAVGYLILAHATQAFADHHYGEAAHAGIFDEELVRLEQIARSLEDAFDQEHTSEWLRVTSVLASRLCNEEWNIA